MYVEIFGNIRDLNAVNRGFLVHFFWGAIPILCNLCHPGSSAVIVEKIYLGTPGMSREAGGSDQRARDRSLPGNKIVFQLLSFVGVGGWVQDRRSKTGQCQNGRVLVSSIIFLSQSKASCCELFDTFYAQKGLACKNINSNSAVAFYTILAKEYGGNV